MKKPEMLCAMDVQLFLDVLQFIEGVGENFFSLFVRMAHCARDGKS